MNTQTKATPEITRAAERYLEQYGDPLVMNTYLKVTILVLAAVCLALAALTFMSTAIVLIINGLGYGLQALFGWRWANSAIAPEARATPGAVARLTYRALAAG